MSKCERIWNEMELKFGRPLSGGEQGAMVRAATLTRGGARKRRKAMRRAAYFPIVLSNENLTRPPISTLVGRIGED